MESGASVQAAPKADKNVIWRSKRSGAVVREIGLVNVPPAVDEARQQGDDEAEVEVAQWSSRPVFVLAAVGSAIGFGNVWRFPYLVHEYGGGTFLIPYALSLVCLGIPTLFLELSLGQILQRTTLEAFEFMSVRWRGLGWACCLATYSIVIYYTCLLSWASSYMVLSFRSELPWKHNPQQFFDDQLLQKSDSITDINHVVPHIAVGYAVLWLVLWFGLTWGTKSIGWLVTVTMPLPFIIVGVLFFRGVTLEGASDGLDMLFKPDYSKLYDVDVWTTAAAQILFSIGVGEGIMITYSSFNQQRDPYLASNCLIVALANSAFSMVAAISLFAFLGHLAHEQGVSVDEVVQAGPGLTFVVFPQVLLTLPGSNALSFLFFLMLVCLGISSAVSMIEPIVSAILHSFGNRQIRLNFGVRTVSFCLSRVWVVTAVCCLAFLLGLLLCTDAGSYWLALFDKALPMFTPLTVVLVQTFAVRFSIGLDGLVAMVRGISRRSVFERWWLFSWKFATPVVVGLMLVLETVALLTRGFGDFPSWAVGLGMALAFGPVCLIPILGFWPVAREKVSGSGQLELVP